jgi:hypothetical protein
MKRILLAAFIILAVDQLAVAAGRGYLGLEFESLPPGSAPGVKVHQVFPGSAADKAGLKAGQFITQIDGAPVADPGQAVAIVTRHGAGDKIVLTMAGNGGKAAPLRIEATLAANPPGGGFAAATLPHLGPPPGGDMPPPARTQITKAQGNGPAAPVALRVLQAGACSAMTPQGWQVTDSNRDSTILTVAAPGGGMRASYGIVGIGSGQAAGYYGPQFRSPAAFAQYATGVVFGAQVYGKPLPAMPHGFQTFTWGTQNGFSGYTIYKSYPLPSDPGGFIVSMYIGGAPSAQVKQLVPLAVGVAASIRCRAQLHPPPANDFHPSRGASCFGSECSEGDAAGSDFNSILGTGYVHDDAGTNYYVGDENWIENGPQGPGYYKRNGNDVTKLQNGLQ